MPLLLRFLMKRRKYLFKHFLLRNRNVRPTPNVFYDCEINPIILSDDFHIYGQKTQSRREIVYDFEHICKRVVEVMDLNGSLYYRADGDAYLRKMK